MIRKTDSSFDVCLACATPREAKVLRKVISHQCNVQFTGSHSRHHSYEYHYTTVQNHKGESLTIHISWQRDGYGPVNASAHLKTVLDECNPRFVGMTGVCAGDKSKVKLGDLVIASCAFLYDDPQQQNVQLYSTNIDSTYLKKGLEAWIRFNTKQEPPLNRELSSEIPPNPTAHITPMASVRTVRRDNPFEDIQKLVREAIAIDMEGASVYHTVASFSGLRSLVAKGVCDYADSEKNDNHRYDAAKISAEYMLWFIKEYVTSDLAPASLLSTDHQ